VTYLLTMALGTAIAFGIAALVGLLLPFARLPVFVVLSVYWLWIGWRYAGVRQRAQQVARASVDIPPGCDLALARSEIAEFFEMANQQAKREGREPVWASALVDAWHAFSADPNLATANALCRAAPPEGTSAVHGPIERKWQVSAYSWPKG